MFEIKQIPKHDDIPAHRSGGGVYPFGTMKVGDSFVVPYAEMREGETSAQFRSRVYQSAREFARRHQKDGEERMKFTAAVMTKDDESETKAFVEGDVVVWRDS